MRVSESWLRTLINPSQSIMELAEQLTQSGIEVDAIEDAVLTLKIPANRGDCLGMEGIAREVALLNNQPYSAIQAPALNALTKKNFPIEVQASELCPKYLGCLIQGIDNSSKKLLWLNERLEKAGLNSVSPVVDVLNYVMLELGQPLHAFDVDAVQGPLVVRCAKENETIRLLDGKDLKLVAGTLVIADDNAIQAIAGVMGSLSSAVTEKTSNVWIESAFFNPISIRLSAKQAGIKTEASTRFERGVDPALQRRALERAVQLITELCGGKVEGIVENITANHLPKVVPITLKKERIAQILGINLKEEELSNFLERLNLKIQKEGEHLLVSPPSYRQDLSLDVDIIEEIGRLYGLHRLPSAELTGAIPLFDLKNATSNNQIRKVKDLLTARGYHEAITYRFIDPKWDALLGASRKDALQGLVLANPIAADLAVMRSSLWPGLLQVVHYNQNRQNSRIRAFEIGTCFTLENGVRVESQKVAGITAGSLMTEQWGSSAKPHDFFDLKADVEAIALGLGKSGIRFEKIEKPELHPGQSAKILLKDKEVGIIATLHPRIIKELGLEGSLSLFELESDFLAPNKPVVFKPLSKFPSVRRDLALLVEHSLLANDLQAAIETCLGEWLEEILVFDVYQGKGILPQQKSIGFGLILRHPSRTLVEGEVNDKIAEVMQLLSTKFQATLRV